MLHQQLATFLVLVSHCMIPKWPFRPMGLFLQRKITFSGSKFLYFSVQRSLQLSYPSFSWCHSRVRVLLLGFTLQVMMKVSLLRTLTQQNHCYLGNIKGVSNPPRNHALPKTALSVLPYMSASPQTILCAIRSLSLVIHSLHYVMRLHNVKTIIKLTPQTRGPTLLLTHLRQVLWWTCLIVLLCPQLTLGQGNILGTVYMRTRRHPSWFYQRRIHPIFDIYVNKNCSLFFT